MEIMDRIERFLREFRTTFEDMPQKEFMENLIGIAKNKLDMFNSLREETDHFWEEICDGRYDWEVVRNEVLTLRSITKEQVLQAYDDWLLPPKNGEGSTDVSRQRRPLVVQIVSQTTKERTSGDIVGTDEDGNNGESKATEDGSEHDLESISATVDDLVSSFLKYTGKQTWGKILL